MKYKEGGLNMIPKLSKEYIESAKLTAFRAENIDTIIKGYKKTAQQIHENIEENKEEKLNKLCNLYNNHLQTLSNYVSKWTSGRASHKGQSTRAIDKSNDAIVEFENEIYEELKEADYQNNKEKYDKKKQRREVAKTLQEIGYYRNVNKSLFYKSLAKLYDLDQRTFKTAYKQLKGEIRQNSSPAILYKEMMNEEWK